jgi:hypothetical protein
LPRGGGRCRSVALVAAGSADRAVGKAGACDDWRGLPVTPVVLGCEPELNQWHCPLGPLSIPRHARRRGCVRARRASRSRGHPRQKRQDKRSAGAPCGRCPAFSGRRRLAAPAPTTSLSGRTLHDTAVRRCQEACR